MQAEQFADLVTTTLKNLGRLKWTDISLGLQKYVAFDQLTKGKTSENVFESGIGIQWNVQVGKSTAAKNVTPTDPDTVVIADAMTTASVPWRHSTTNYGFIRQFVTMNNNPSKIVDMIKVERHKGINSMIELFESNFWTGAADANSNAPYGVPYWITRSATEGFNGGNHAEWSAGPGGISCSTYANWKNWTANYTAVTKEDLIRKWRKASVFTKFTSPNPQPNYAGADDYGYYTNYSVVGLLEEVLEGQNDNLGNDVAAKDGLTTFRRRPVQWVPYLESDTTNPIYGINWGVMKPKFLSGEFMNESAPKDAANQHNIKQIFIDTSYNYICEDRRQLFVLYA